MSSYALTIAAADSADEAKRSADIVCSGAHDEQPINEALASLEGRSGKVYFRNGTYNIDSLTPHPAAGLGGVCITGADAHRALTLEGENQTWFSTFPSYDISGGVIFNVTDKAFGDIDGSVPVSGLIAFPDENGKEPFPGRVISVTNIALRLPTNQRPDTCGVNLHHVSGLTLSNVFVTTADPFDRMQLPAPGTRGIYGLSGSKIAEYRLTMCIVRGFERGFDLPGEHIVADGCYATYCKYPYYLAGDGTYTYHTSVFLKCGHEDCLYGPYFGEFTREGSLYEFIAYDSEFSVGALFSQRGGAIEANPGFSRGHVSHTATLEGVGIRSYPFWEKGSGSGFVTRQSLEGTACGPQTDLNSTPWLNEIHRGIVTDTVRENTLSAFRLTGELGYKYLECDLRTTRDGVPVMSHDDTIPDAEGRPFTISELTYDELKDYPLTAAGETVPSFEDALKTVYPYGITLNAEMKTRTAEFYRRAAELVIELGMSGRTVYNLNTADRAMVDMVAQLDKRARFLFPYDPATLMSFQDLYEDRTRVWIVIPDHRVTQEIAREIRRSGHMFMIYHVNDPAWFDYRPDIIEYRTDLGARVGGLIRDYLRRAGR